MMVSSLWLLADVQNVRACSCLPTSPSEYFNRDSTYAIFLGKVVDHQAFTSGYAGVFESAFMSGRTRSVYEIRVTTIWKGPAYEYVYLTEHASFACGGAFTVGREYLFYAGPLPSEGDMSAGLCGSKRRTSANADLRELRELAEGRRPRSGTRAPRPSLMGSSSWLSDEQLSQNLALALSNLSASRERRLAAWTATTVPPQASVDATAASRVSAMMPASQPGTVCKQAGTPHWLFPVVAGILVVAELGILGTIYMVSRRGRSAL